MKRAKFTKLLWLFLVVSFVVFFPLASQAQTTYGSIVGNARDPSRAAIPGVTVAVTNDGTGVTYTQLTNELGAYGFTTLFPGVYSIHAEKTAFRSINIRHITLQVDQTARYDLAMEVGQIVQKVEVLASAPVLAKDSADVGQVIDNHMVKDLPLNGRNYLQLAGLTNGIVVTRNQEAASESGGPTFLSEGGRPTQNSFLLDGVETRVQRTGGYGINLSIDAIQEFKVMENSFAAEFGRGTAIVNAVIKSGGNQFHGSAFEFLRNDKFDARNTFDVKKAPLRMNQFGASVGGPIKKDKAFFFFDYEGQRVRTGRTVFTNVPTPAMLQGDLSGVAGVVKDPFTGQPFTNNQIPANRFSQFAKAAIPLYPVPNSNVLPKLNFQAVLSNQVNMNQWIGRIDENLSSKDRISGHLIFFRYATVNPGALPFSGSGSHSFAQPNVSAEWTHTFGPHLLNDFTFGYGSTDTLHGFDRVANRDLTPDFGLKNLTPEPFAFAPPGVSIGGFGFLGGSPFIPNGAHDINRQFGDQLTFTTGRHTIKVGTDLRFLRYNDLGFAVQNGFFDFEGAYTGNSVGDFLLGIPQTVFGDQRGGKAFSFKTTNGEFSFYGQDSIRVTRSLTFNAGLRYEYVQWPEEDNNEFANYNFQKGTLDFAGKQIPRRIIPPDKNDFAPRAGIAYSPSFLKNTVVRAGGGFVYGNFRQWEVSLFHFQPPFVFDRFLFNDIPNPAFTTATLFDPVNTDLSQIDFRKVTVNFQSPDKVLPVMYQWTFTVQHELLPNLMLEVGYVGNHAIRQPNRYDANGASLVQDLANPTSIQSRRPFQNVGFVSGNTSRAFSSYNALNIRLERRFSSGLEILGSYTWSKALGIRPHDNWTVFDINNIRRNYGPVDDFTHQAVISYVYDLPFGPGKRFMGSAQGVLGLFAGGWQVNGVTSFRSGGALTLSSNTSNLLGNRAGNVPIRLCNGNLPNSQRSAKRYFDTSCFVNPPVGRYGNAATGALRGPGFNNWDVSIFKNTKVTERAALQFRAEFFNAFNRANLSDPDLTTSDASFGRITSANDPREIQFGLKFLF